MLEEREENAIFSERVLAGRRVYFIDVKRSSKGDLYLVISERRRTEEGKVRDRIWVFKEDLDKFLEALEKATRVVREGGASS